MAWFFLRVPDCRTYEGVKSFSSEIKKLGRIYEYDLGTETKRDAGWYTVFVAVQDVPAVRERLRDLDISGYVDQVEPLRRAIDGRAVSRQLGLF